MRICTRLGQAPVDLCVGQRVVYAGDVVARIAYPQCDVPSSWPLVFAGEIFTPALASRTVSAPAPCDIQPGGYTTVRYLARGPLKPRVGMVLGKTYRMSGLLFMQHEGSVIFSECERVRVWVVQPDGAGSRYRKPAYVLDGDLYVEEDDYANVTGVVSDGQSPDPAW
jgi:hypothetical protein